MCEVSQVIDVCVNGHSTNIKFDNMHKILFSLLHSSSEYIFHCKMESFHSVIKDYQGYCNLFVKYGVVQNLDDIKPLLLTIYRYLVKYGYTSENVCSEHMHFINGKTSLSVVASTNGTLGIYNIMGYDKKDKLKLMISCLPDTTHKIYYLVLDPKLIAENKPIIYHKNYHAFDNPFVGLTNYKDMQNALA